MASTRMYVLAIVTIILITALVIVFLNDGRVVPEQTNTRLGEIYSSAPDNAIQKVFEDRTARDEAVTET